MILLLHQIIEFLINIAKIKINDDTNQVNNILQSTSFYRLQQLEKENGFMNTTVRKTQENKRKTH